MALTLMGHSSSLVTGFVASGDETLRFSALARRITEQAVRRTHTPASRTYLRPMLVL